MPAILCAGEIATQHGVDPRHLYDHASFDRIAFLLPSHSDALPSTLGEEGLQDLRVLEAICQSAAGSR